MGGDIVFSPTAKARQAGLCGHRFLCPLCISLCRIGTALRGKKGITSAAICMKLSLDQSLPRLQSCLFLPRSLLEMEELYSPTNQCNIIEMLILYMSQHSNSIQTTNLQDSQLVGSLQMLMGWDNVERGPMLSNRFTLKFNVSFQRENNIPQCSKECCFVLFCMLSALFCNLFFFFLPSHCREGRSPSDGRHLKQSPSANSHRPAMCGAMALWCGKWCPMARDLTGKWQTKMWAHVGAAMWGDLRALSSFCNQRDRMGTEEDSHYKNVFLPTPDLSSPPVWWDALFLQQPRAAVCRGKCVCTEASLVPLEVCWSFTNAVRAGACPCSA